MKLYLFYVYGLDLNIWSEEIRPNSAQFQMIKPDFKIFARLESYHNWFGKIISCQIESKLW